MIKKISKYFWQFMEFMTPKNESHEILKEIAKLDESNPENYSKLAMLHLRLHNGYGVMLGKLGDDSYNFLLTDLHYSRYKYYREEWIKYKGRGKKLQHEVIVYDGDGKELERTMQPIRVTHMKRFKHTFDDYTTYSFNTYYDDGLMCLGEVPPPAFGDAIVKHLDC